MTVTETPLSHAEAARHLFEHLRSLQVGFPMPPATLDRQTRPRNHRLLPDRFFEMMAVALDSSSQFAATTPLSPAEIRDMLRYGEAYLPVAEELERFARGIRYGVAVRRSKVGRAACAAYRIAQGMNLPVDIDLPVPEVASMKRAIVDRRRKGAGPAPSPVTTTVKNSSP